MKLFLKNALKVKMVIMYNIFKNKQVTVIIGVLRYTVGCPTHF